MHLILFCTCPVLNCNSWKLDDRESYLIPDELFHGTLELQWAQVQRPPVCERLPRVLPHVVAAIGCCVFTPRSRELSTTASGVWSAHFCIVLLVQFVLALFWECTQAKS